MWVLPISQMTSISYTLSPTTKLNQEFLTNPEFGKQCSDHMFSASYRHGIWSDFQIVPYGKIEFFPSMLALHYGQSVFEGMKAFRMKDGNISVFRPLTHFNRFNRSLERMCMPPVTEAMFMDGLTALLKTDHAWIPSTPGSSLYLRPFCFASESRLKIKISDEYQFYILTSPAGKYFGKPYRLKVETYYTRTAEGGTGYAKCAGNYGSSYYPVKKANDEGFDQVLWTDARDHQYIDEAGMMNIMFVAEGKLITPALNTAILAGVTRDSILTLARDWGMVVEERRISVAELDRQLTKGTITEAFGTGTAAVVAPVATIRIGNKDHAIPPPEQNSFQNKAASTLQDIRSGATSDRHHWNYIIRQ